MVMAMVALTTPGLIVVWVLAYCTVKLLLMLCTDVGGDLTGDDHRGGIRRGGLGVRAQVNAHARGQRGDEQMGGCSFENGFHGEKLLKMGWVG